VFADGVCRPKADTYGYYQTQWRTWPKPIVESTVGGPRDEIKLPTQIEPPATQEDLDNPPRPPLEPGDMGDVPPVKPATGDESPMDHPRPAGGEHLPTPPRTDKPDPFRDDPIPNNSGRPRETSILIPPLADPKASYGLLDEAPAVPTAIRSSYDERPRPASGAAAASGAAVLRLVDVSAASQAVAARQAVATSESPPQTKAIAAAGESADGGNPLRSGWGTRGESPLREPSVVTKFGGSAASNPLRR
jgi:hypothetical protein